MQHIFESVPTQHDSFNESFDSGPQRSQIQMFVKFLIVVEIENARKLRGDITLVNVLFCVSWS